jgi:hypothetical protein
MFKFNKYILFFILFTSLPAVAFAQDDIDLSFLKNLSALFDVDNEQDKSEVTTGSDDIINWLSNEFGQEKQETVEPVQDQKVNPLHVKIQNKSEKTYQDFKKHKAKYFTKVFLVREKFFATMTPEFIATALQEIIDMLTHKPWLYLEQLFKDIFKQLTDKEKKEWADLGYNLDYIMQICNNRSVKETLKSGGGHWEFIADQLCFYNEFIECARVDLDNGIVFLDKKYGGYWGRYLGGFSPFKKKKDVENIELLKDYWNKRGVTAHHNLYALSFDYYGKLFLAQILNLDLNEAYRFYDDLKIIMDKLCGTEYEAERQEDIKTYKELLGILKDRTKTKFDEEEDKNKSKYFEEMMDFYDMD